MVDLPIGTVTFLFTDIVGSTQLLHELGPGYDAVFTTHRQLLRAAFEAHHGHEVGPCAGQAQRDRGVARHVAADLLEQLSEVRAHGDSPRGSSSRMVAAHLAYHRDGATSR